MLSSRIKKDWLKELELEAEKLHAECVTLDELKKTLEERVELLESVDFSTKNIVIKEENAKELQKNKSELQQTDRARTRKGRRLTFVQELKKYVEGEQLRPGT